jgi:hypothetical protein
MQQEELLEAYPTDVYLTGILFPPGSEIAREDTDQQQAEGIGGNDAREAGQDEISLASSKRPATAGLSFVVESDSVPAIEVTFDAGIYRREEKENADSTKLFVWRRSPASAVLARAPIALNFSSQDFGESETGIKGLRAHIRTSAWGKKVLVTVAMVNAQDLPEAYERESYEEICFFQAQITVRPATGTRFCPRALQGSAIDEDTLMARLIYRDVNEYAVGHTCSASWTETDSKVSHLNTTWLPRSFVKSVRSAGVEKFATLLDKASGPVLSTKWLSEARGRDLTSGLERLVFLYREWVGGEEGRAGSFEEPLRNQARKHIKAAREVADRIAASIALITPGSDVEIAFRLANRAIMVQRAWTKPDEPPLVWRPFQLAFILLSLQSSADDRHPDRNVADLLWFPTGGGKTEAYLGLIAFTLFLRRLRYGNAGAGVASFMRYTLRLLTIQQFQRAAAVICACDAIRQGENVPADIDPDLGDIPFSLGLWVGGDATPNRFEDAATALADARALNRPDQLKYCPQHTGIKLLWSADTNRREIHAFCDDPGCLWNSTPLPVWTVDDSIYEKTPSLVIGTIDKFAQIARRKETRRLFGSGTGFRAPDLIIQDELHLISGPLGTLAGLYEVAIDRLCSDGTSKPKIIASTATIRQASSQIYALFHRKTCLFPPPILDASNSGFSVDDDTLPGREYVGLTTAGRSAKFALQAVAASVMQAALSKEISDDVRDDLWTLVTYFNSLRELGGALVLMQDDVNNSLANYATRRGEEARDIDEPMELTSRVSSSEIKEYLDQLSRRFSEQGCCDVVLASNMISVGIDVQRLGVMIVNGQPKGIAEYIQATSRVGRREQGPGGLVITIHNNAKARDRSHFETFRTWHMALYREVEATSVTPFAPRARQKALHAALVILARHMIPELSGSVRDVNQHEGALENFIEYITERANDIDSPEAVSVGDELREFLERWSLSSQAYKYYWNDMAWNKSLMISAEKAAELQARQGVYQGRAVPTPNSMRNVEPGTLFKLEEQLRD